MTETEVYMLAREAFAPRRPAEAWFKDALPEFVRFAEVISEKERKRALSVVCDECAAALE